MGIFSGIARNLDSHGNDAATHDKQTSQLFPHYNDSGMRRCYDRTDGAEYLWFLQSDPVYRCYNSIHFSRRQLDDYQRFSCRYAESRSVPSIQKA